MYVYGIHDDVYKFLYVGLTSLSVEERFRLHKVKARQGSAQKIHLWLKENMTRAYAQTLETVESNDVFAEARWIAILDTHQTGLNVTPTGKGAGKFGVTLSEEAKRKISESRIGMNNFGHPGGFTGKNHSDQTKKQMSESAKSRNNIHGRCIECGLESTKRGLAFHRNSSGHSSFE